MAVIIAGTHSGCGKSTITLGILAALRRRGDVVQAFKAGPDFIDPGLHTVLTGRPSRNLDLWMCGEGYVRESLARHGATADAVVIEGVMGLYDGQERSTAALARATGAKVVLVVDAYGMAESCGAVIRGFDSSGVRLSGVIFNNVGSDRHERRLRDAAGGVEVLGRVERDAGLSLPERHLGLTVAEEGVLTDEAVARFADTFLAGLEMDRIKALAAPDGEPLDPPAPLPAPDVRLAVARDRAFCFYYEDNLDLLREAGAELVAFSPLADSALPPEIHGIYLGGGYPELHAAALAENRAMRAAIQEWAVAGRPLYAECGGLMYLGSELENEGRRFPMAGVFPFTSRMDRRRRALGYREARLGHDCLLGRRGSVLRGHEFHYSYVAEWADQAGVRTNVLGEPGPALSSFLGKATLAGYTHVHFGSQPAAARAFTDYLRGRPWI